MPAPAGSPIELALPQVEQMTVSFIGLGKMGSRMAARLAMGGHTVYGWDNNPDAREVAVALGVLVPDSLEDTIEAAGVPGDRTVWHMLPAKVSEEGLRDSSRVMSPGDRAIDGGNTHFDKSDEQAQWLGALGIRYLGIGTSGGILAYINGYPFMVGGDQGAYEEITPLLNTLSHPNGGHDYLGPGGSGHFAKAVHNGIEYPIMQAYGEGFGLIRARGMDVARVARLYQRGTLIAGFLMDVTAEVLSADPDLSDFTGEIGSASGEALWTVDEAARLGVPTELIEAAIDFRRRSGSDPAVRGSFAAQVVAAQRNFFGGHDQSRQYVK